MGDARVTWWMTTDAVVDARGPSASCDDHRRGPSKGRALRATCAARPCSARLTHTPVAPSRGVSAVATAAVHRSGGVWRAAATGRTDDAVGKRDLSRSLQTISSGRGVEMLEYEVARTG